MKILIAGSNTRGVEDCCKKYNMPKLYSFFNEKGLIERWDDQYSLMVDSGAHTWNKDSEKMGNVGMKRRSKLKPAGEFIETYFNFIQQYKDKKVVFVEFDVYSHLPMQQIDEFWERLKVLNPVSKFIRVYHPLLDGGSLKILKKWIDEGHTYIGIGNDSTEILDDVFALTRDKIKLHGFAMTKLPLMERYPFYSVDSTSPLASVIFGKYSMPQMKYKKRAEIIKEKSTECYHDDHERMEKCITDLIIVQNYITELWAKKGVIWSDITFQ